MKDYQKIHFDYVKKTGIKVTFEDFMKVNTLHMLHRYAGLSSVVGYNPNLRIYPHFMHFGDMFFYQYLTIQQLVFGPTVEPDCLAPCY